MAVGGMSITGIVIGFIIGMVGLVLWAPQSQATDTMYRQFVGHGNVGEQTMLVLHDESGSNYSLTEATDKTCTFAQPTPAVTSLFDEDGNTVSVSGDAGTAGAVTGCEWVPVPDVLKKFATINKLMASILPLMVVIGFMSVGFLTARRYTGGSITQMVSGEVMGLIIVIVAIYLMPILIQFITEAAVMNDGRLQSQTKFGTIIGLVFSLLPLTFVLGIMGVTMSSGYKAVRSFGGGTGETVST